MSFVSSRPNAVLADKAWRIKNSLWLWWVFLGAGLLGCVGFLIVAARVRTKKFWIAAVVASSGSAIAILVMALTGELAESEAASGSKTSDTASDAGWGGGVAAAVWVAQIVYALMINRDYLRWKADGNNEWFNQPIPTQAAAGFVSAPPTGQPVVPPPAPFLGVDTSNYYAAPTPAAAAPLPTPPPAPQPSYERGEPVTRTRATEVDINGASAADLSIGLNLADATVRRIIEARLHGGSFDNLDDLVARAQLQPHEMVRLRDQVRFDRSRTTSPSADAQRSDDRPLPPSAPGAGRILDF